jgi:hypothetical protein
MKKSAAMPCSTAVGLFRGLYARVGRSLGLDASYISRVARGERKCKIAEKALNREFNNVLVSIKTASARSGKTRMRATTRRVEARHAGSFARRPVRIQSPPQTLHYRAISDHKDMRLASSLILGRSSRIWRSKRQGVFRRPVKTS